MRRMAVTVVLGALLVGLTSCAVNSQWVSPAQESGEARLTLGTIQREIRRGMTASAVAEALGAPNIVTTDEARREVWIYDRVSTERVHELGFAGLLLVGYSREASVQSQRSLTVIVKFDSGQLVRDYAYHATRF